MKRLFGLIVIVLALFAAAFVRGCCATFVDSYQMGYRYDAFSGKLTHLNRTGLIFHAPFFTEIHTVDLRPMQVCINANARVLNCKLVQFQPEGLDLFLSWHGRDNYDGNVNSTSSTSNTAATPTVFNQILMSYAFDGSGTAYPFMKVLRDLKPEEAAKGVTQ